MITIQQNPVHFSVIKYWVVDINAKHYVENNVNALKLLI